MVTYVGERRSNGNVTHSHTSAQYGTRLVIDYGLTALYYTLHQVVYCHKAYRIQVVSSVYNWNRHDV